MEEESAQFTLTEFQSDLVPPAQSHLKELKTLVSYWKIAQKSSNVKHELVIGVPASVQKQISHDFHSYGK